MKVTYLDHSGFMVTLDGVILVFDYYRDPANALEKELKEQPESQVVFLVSHHHPDHFNNAIFDLAQNHKRMYVLSDDIFSKLVPDKGLSVAWLKAGDPSIEIFGGLSLKAYGSTDVGCSYAVTTKDGKVIFHAGDFNCWHWQDESTKREVAKAENEFTVELNRIAQAVPEMYVAMFPVDTRLGTDFAKGAREFTSKIKVDNFFPMHFWKEPSKACEFNDYISTLASTECYCLDRPGHSVYLA